MEKGKNVTTKLTAGILAIFFGWFTAAILQDFKWHIFTLLGIAILFYPKKEKKDLTNIFKQTGLTKKTGNIEDIPRIIAKKETENGFEALLTLPVGLSSKDFIRKSQSVGEALNADVEFKYHKGKIAMVVNKRQLKTYENYRPVELPGEVEIPVGLSKKGLETLNFSDEYSSLLVAGTSGYGKTAFLRQALVNLVVNEKQNLKLCLVDLKFGAEFGIFKKCSMVEEFAIHEKQVLDLCRKLEGIVEERYREFQAHDVVKISNYNEEFKPMSYYLVVIDEFATLSANSLIMEKLIYLARICRAAGVFFIFATQYPTTEAIPSALKFNCQSRIAFKVKTAINSRVIIDRDGAEDLPCPGRAILSTNRDVIVQVPFLNEKEAINLIKKTYREGSCVAPKEKSKGEVLTIDEFKKFKGIRDNKEGHGDN